MSENSVVLPAVLLELSKQGAVGFRNNTGVGWIGNGQPVRITKLGAVTLRPGDVILRGPVRPLYAGLVNGGSDVIGWTSVIITTEMVGKTAAVFTAVEAKTKTGRASDEQKNFIERVIDAGGIAGIARCANDVIQILRNYRGETK